MKLGIISSYAPIAGQAREELESRYEFVVDPASADVIVALGGDGTMLDALHYTMTKNIPVFGMNRGSVGFLLNDYSPDNLIERITAATTTEAYPLETHVTNIYGATFEHLAINDVSITRQTGQAAKLAIRVNQEIRIEELIGDGLIVSTPVGSTAYNRSAGGPILPLEAPLHAITPICAFRPRHWKGAIVPDSFEVEVDVIDSENRRVNVSVDSAEIKDVARVRIVKSKKKIHILCDLGRSWSEKLLSEQFYG